MSRQSSKLIKRIVVKLGSSLIADYQLKPRKAHLQSLVKQISAIHSKGTEVVIVSSGAIVLGMGELNEKTRPTDLASLQANAAIGQAVLMRLYGDLFARHKKKCAQILLTWDDFDNRARYNNARSTLSAILDRGVIPIINENDTISTDEIKFGDNDKLSALVATMSHADLLIILSDVEGVYDLKSEDKKIFREVKELSELDGVAQGTQNKNMSKGGMITKIDAVKIATHARVPCIITSGHLEDVLVRIANHERVGTYFHEKEDKLLSRKHWIAFGVKPKGTIVVDDGAKKALVESGKSLLLPGVVSWDGHFKANDVVVVCDRQGEEFARGIVNYSIGELHKIDDKKGKSEVIHRDDLVISKGSL